MEHQGWTFYVVMYRPAGADVLSWWFTEMKAIPGSYQNYPVMYQTKEWAERHAEEFKKEYNSVGKGLLQCETRVEEVTIPVPKG